MKKFISLFIVASLLLSFGSAPAADKTVADQRAAAKSGKQRLKFDDCDKGNTGALTFEEAQGCWPRLDKKKFDAIDTNKDGKITKKELKEHRKRAGAHKKARHKTE